MNGHLKGRDAAIAPDKRDIYQSKPYPAAMSSGATKSNAQKGDFGKTMTPMIDEASV
jgi:hypothetical protein